MEKYVSPTPTVQVLTQNSLDLTPDGHHAVFIRDGEMLGVEMAAGESFPIPARIDYRVDMPVHAVWSPDGAMLAYIQSDKNIPVILERSSGRTLFEANRPICSVYCMTWSPVWTSDGRLLYVAEPAVMGEAAPAAHVSNVSDEHYGRTRAPGGVVVMQSAPTKKELGRIESKFSDDMRGPCRGGCQPSQVVAIDPRSGASSILAEGAPFKGIIVADNAKFAILAVSVPPLPTQQQSRYYSYYLLPLGDRKPRSPRIRVAGPTDGEGNPLRLLAANVSNWQVGRSVSIAPSGRYMAYTTTGKSATGDVYLVDIASGRQVNLTERVELPPNPFDVDPRKIVTAAPAANFAGKFGSDYFAPLWSNDEHAVLVVRPERENGALRYRLWRVPLSKGKAEPLSMSGFSIEAIAQCQNGQSHCRFGPDKRILASLRMRQADGGDHLIVGAIHETDGEVHVIHDVGAIGASGEEYSNPEYEMAALLHEFVLARDGRRAVGLLKPSDAPPELWQVQVDGEGNASASSLRVLQKGPVPALIVKRVEFTSATGEQLSVRIELPTDYRRGERLPAVMIVYGSMRASINPEFNGGLEAALRYGPLRDARYAVLLPDLPAVPTPGGHNCDYMASNALAALDAAAGTGFIDPERIGLMGHSWGGYSVFCIASRTDRFKAGIANAGLANLLSVGVVGIGKRGGFRGLANFVGAPWENPDWYVHESPGFRLDKIVTPLMIVYGVKDENVDLSHSIEMFDGLSELGRQTQLIGYDDSDHSAMLAYKDFWRRSFEWFDHYLGVTQEEKSARSTAP